MKKLHVSYVFLTAAALLLSGCGIFSLHPLFRENDLITSDKLVGTWQNTDDRKTLIIVDKIQGDKRYSFVHIDGSDTVRFTMGLVRLKDNYFIDLFPSDDCSFSGTRDDCRSLENLARNYIPAHSFMKFEYTESGFALTGFENERLIKLFKENKIRLAHEIPGNKDDDDSYVVITAATDDLQKFISRYANDKDAFDETENYHRL